MRLPLCALAAALLASPALSQTHLADSTGGYVALHELAFGSAARSALLDLDGTVGWRFASGFDVGVRVGYEQRLGTDVLVAPTLGYSRPLGGGSFGRIEGAVFYGERDWIRSSPEAGAVTYGDRRVGGDLTATVSRPVRLLGSVRLHPTLGGYAAVDHRFDTAYPEDMRPVGAGSDVGVHMGLPLSFRLFGQDVAVSPYARLSLLDGVLSAPTYGGGGLRLNF